MDHTPDDCVTRARLGLGGKEVNDIVCAAYRMGCEQTREVYQTRIEKLEAALRSVLQYRLTDETWVKLGFDPKKIRVEFDAAREALEKKDD
jgi:hypothetical protein